MENLIEAIEKINEGEIYLTEDYQFLLNDKDFVENLKLTEREIDIMQLIIKEFTNLEIAKNLKISVSTVENHRKSIFQKLKVKNVAGMVREACNLGY